MAAFSLGKLSCTPGTRRRITAGQADEALTITCNSIMVQTLSSSTGKIYIGNKNLDKTTLIGCFAVLPVPTSNSIPSFSVGNPTGMAAFSASEVYFDGDSTSDGVLSSYVR